eukprot:TRINITY_DN75951_c0_g1_i1.p1 TRINITY_DN75951_c0_g1~~TRINITY_DN75951_c0_g1_i1.p1  ORF type:complete len:288 (-),score=38.38 TRINITY_DN75951_c0_g1_i1:47-868(-)
MTKGSSTAPIADCAHSPVPPASEASLLAVSPDILLRIQVAVGDPASVCAVEASAACIPRPCEAAWAEVLEEFFPTCAARLVSEGFVGSYKQVFTRRARRAEEWQRRKESQQRSKEGVDERKSAKPKKKAHNKLLYADNRQGTLSDSTLRLRTCDRCGEKYAPSSRSDENPCRNHSGILEPAGPDSIGLSRADRQQIAKSARMAIKNCGGVASRRTRGAGHGHWSRGLALPAAVGRKDVLWEGSCSGPGEFHCEWSCCRSVGIFAPGCTVGRHC